MQILLTLSLLLSSMASITTLRHLSSHAAPAISAPKLSWSPAVPHVLTGDYNPESALHEGRPGA
jgi:hypothetical protein